MRKLIVFILLLPVTLLAQKNYPALIDSYMQAQASLNDFTGAVLVAQKGKVIYQKAFGMANREWEISNTVQTKFEIGSITKQFTAVCILQLVDEGKLKLDDKLSKFFPDFPNADNVTIHMLLNHTSGITSYTSLPEYKRMAPLSIPKDSMVAMIKKQPYKSSPGTKWTYNNSGYYLLGYIVEKVSGQSYSDYMFTHVIQKAGLKNTFVNRWDSILTCRASGYQKKAKNGWINTSFISMEVAYSAGAMISTVEDLYQWNKALFSSKVISSSMLAKMTTPYMNNYGYGLEIDSLQQHFRIGHGGAINGFKSYLTYFPTEDIVVVGLSNNYACSIQAIMEAVTGILLDLPVTNHYIHKEVSINTSLLKRYEGKCQSQGTILTFEERDGKLYLKYPPDHEFLMKPESTTKFFMDEFPNSQFEFEVDNAGNLLHVYNIFAGLKIELKKL